MNSAGSTFSAIAYPLMLLELTNSTWMLTASLSLFWTPRIVLMVVGGALSDAVPPIRVLRATKLVSVTVTSTIAIVFVFDAMYTWLLLVGSLSNGLISVFSRPSETKLIVEILEEKSLLGANTVMRGSFQVLDSAMPTIAGSSLGLAIMYMPDRYAFSAALAVDALAFLCAYVLLGPLARRWKAKGFSPGRWRWAAGHVVGDFGLGVRELGRSRLTLLLVYAGLSNLLTAGAFAIGVPLLATAWPNPASVLGLTGSALAIGAFLGSAFAATFEDRAVGIWIAAVLVSSVVAGVLLASVYFAMDVSLLLVVSLLGLVSVAGSVNTLLVTTMTQLFSKTEYVGRVSSLFLAVNAGSSVLSYSVFTSLQGAVGLGPAYVAFGLCSIVAVLPLCWFRPQRGSK